MRRKLAGSGLAILGILALGIGGTYSSLTSSKSGPSTLVQSGTLNLRLTDGGGVSIAPITFGNLKPGEQRFYFIQLTNSGTIPAGRVRWAFENHSELENGCESVEIAAGDTTCNSDEGELGSQLAVTFSRISGSDCAGPPEAVDPEGFPPIHSSPRFTSINGLVLASGATKCIRVVVRFKDLGTNNQAQGDSSRFGFRFQLVS